MKIVKTFALMLVFGMVTAGLVACGNTEEKATLGTYNSSNQTFTALTSDAEYSLTQDGYNLVLKGTIPYSESVLGIEAGNIVAIRFTAPSGVTVGGDEAYVKTTNRQDEGGWNEYDETAFEEDGSLVWVTSVSKENDVQVKIKWNANTAEVTYTLSVDDSATLSQAPQA